MTLSFLWNHERTSSCPKPKPCMYTKFANVISNFQNKENSKNSKADKFKIKSLVSYKIIVSETCVTSIEVIAMMHLINYLQKIEQMEEGTWE